MAWRSSGKLGWLFSTTTAGIAAVHEVAVRAAKEFCKKFDIPEPVRKQLS
jgi:hypothetical protein